MQVFRAFGRPAPARALGRRGSIADALDRLLRAAVAEALLLPAERPQPDRAHDAPERAQRLLDVAARHQRADRRGRLRRQPVLRRRGRPRRSRRSTGSGSSSTSARSRRSCSRGCGSAGSSRRSASSSGCRRPSSSPTSHTSPLIQAAVHRFCERRLLDRHVSARRHASTAAAAPLLLGGARRRMPAGVSWTEPRGGFSLLLTLPRRLDAARAAPARRSSGAWRSRPARRSSWTAAGSARCGCRSPRCPCGAIDEGVRRLAEAIKADRRRGRARGTGPSGRGAGVTAGRELAASQRRRKPWKS